MYRPFNPRSGAPIQCNVVSSGIIIGQIIIIREVFPYTCTMLQHFTHSLATAYLALFMKLIIVDLLLREIDRQHERVAKGIYSMGNILSDIR